jgi:hypothetical protein
MQKYEMFQVLGQNRQRFLIIRFLNNVGNLFAVKHST